MQRESTEYVFFNPLLFVQLLAFSYRSYLPFFTISIAALSRSLTLSPYLKPGEKSSIAFSSSSCTDTCYSNIIGHKQPVSCVYTLYTPILAFGRHRNIFRTIADVLCSRLNFHRNDSPSTAYPPYKPTIME